LDTSALADTLKRLEQLITRDAESFTDPIERQVEFDRRLERTRHIMGCLGNPERAFDVIHIGGTSGKGSVAMICEAILLAAGRRVGTHTTPYLQTPLEKVRLNRHLIDPEAAIRLGQIALACVEALRSEETRLGKPHYAEAWLGLAMKSFAERGCDVGVIEVGMGGRYDCTNVVTPRVSAITTIHYDHIRVLGDTLAEIAGHKAGIIKPGVPSVAGEMLPEALSVIEAEAAGKGSRLVRLGREVSYQPLEVSRRGGRFSYRGLAVSFDDLHVGLLGAHQFANAATALAALELYAEQSGAILDEASVREGLASVRFAGRLEVMQQNPTVVLDGAHNEEKVGALVTALPEVFRYRRLILVVGMLEAKNARPIMGRLAELADIIITTAPRVRGKPAIPSSEMAAMARRTAGREVVDGGEPLSALDQALMMAGPDDLVVVTGSLYLIGTARSRWHTVEDIIARGTMFPNGMADTDSKTPLEST
jgi:dihydrofolate synthase/folylpolyglutamate synthase